MDRSIPEQQILLKVVFPGTILLSIFLLLPAFQLSGNDGILEDKPLMAVFELMPGDGVDGETAVRMSETIRQVLKNSGQFAIVERPEMIRRLEEKKVEQTIFCERTECIVQLGEALEVPEVVVGNIRLEGDRYFLSLRIVKIVTSEDLNKIEVNRRCAAAELDGLVREALAELLHSWALENLTPTPTRTPLVIHLTPDSTPSSPTIVAPASPWYKKWYTWGLGALAIGGVAVVAGKSNPGQPDPTETLTPSPSVTSTPTITPTITPTPTETPLMGCKGEIGEAWISTIGGMRFFMNCFESQNEANNKPAGNLSWLDAVNACGFQKKRLCTSDEWKVACAGPKGYAYPYGNEYIAGNCNTHGSGVQDSFQNSNCISEYGIYDMSGNLAEMTSDEVPGNTDFVWKMGGDWRSGASSSCSEMVEFDKNTEEIYTGYRCCRDPDDQTKAKEEKKMRKRQWKVVTEPLPPIKPARHERKTGDGTIPELAHLPPSSAEPARE